MGLCIGISFYDVSENLVGVIVAGINWIQRHKKCKDEKNVEQTRFFKRKKALQVKSVELSPERSLNEDMSILEKNETNG